MSFNLSNNKQLSCTNNDISFRSKCQQRKVIDIVPTQKELLDNPLGYLENNLSKGEKVILNHYLGLSNQFDNIYYAQSTIAKKTGYTREYTNKKLKRLRELGLIDYNYKHMKTCDYKISSWFLNPEIREKLKSLFSSLRYLPLIWILASNAINQTLFTQSINTYNEFIQEHENRFDIFHFNNFHKLKSYEKKGDLDLKAFSDAVDSAFSTTHNLDIPAPIYLSGLKDIFKLTEYGIKYISCYSLPNIIWSMERLLAKQDLTGNQWTYFNKLLSVYCKENNVEPDWSNLPVVPAAATKELQSVDRKAIKEWLANSSSLSFRKKEKLASVIPLAQVKRTWVTKGSKECCYRCKGKYCCGNCELNKQLGPMKVTGNMRTCDMQRKEIT